MILFLVVQRVPNWVNSSKLVGESLRELNLTDLNKQAKQIRISQTAQPLVLVFWATWCGPCSFELSRIASLIEEKSIPAEAVKAISMDEDFEALMKVSEERKYPFEVLWDEKGAAASQLKISVTPTTVFVNPQKGITQVLTGVSPLLAFHLKSHFKKSE